MVKSQVYRAEPATVWSIGILDYRLQNNMYAPFCHDMEIWFKDLKYPRHYTNGELFLKIFQFYFARQVAGN